MCLRCLKVSWTEPPVCLFAERPPGDDLSTIQQPHAYSNVLRPWNWLKFPKLFLSLLESRQNISVYGSGMEERCFNIQLFYFIFPLNLAVCCGNLQALTVGRKMAQRSCISAKS